MKISYSLESIKTTFEAIESSNPMDKFKLLARLSIRKMLQENTISQETREYILKVLHKDRDNKVATHFYNSLQPWYNYFSQGEGKDFATAFKAVIADSLMTTGWLEGEEYKQIFTEREKHPFAHYIDLDINAIKELYTMWEEKNEQIYIDDSLNTDNQLKVRSFVQNFFAERYNEFSRDFIESLPEIPKNLEWEPVFHLSDREDNTFQIETLAQLSHNPRRWCTVSPSTIEEFTSGSGNAMYILTGENTKSERIAYVAIRIVEGQLTEISHNKRNTQFHPFVANCVLEKIAHLQNITEDSSGNDIPIFRENKNMKKKLKELKKNAIAHSLVNEMNIGTVNESFLCIEASSLNKAKLESLFGSNPNKLLLVMGYRTLQSFGYPECEETANLQEKLLVIKEVLEGLLLNGSPNVKQYLNQLIKKEQNDSHGKKEVITA